MNIKEYIQSGIIESYVLGLADKEEVAELELLRSKHPEIEAAIQGFQSELEKFSVHNALPVAPDTKEKIFSRIHSVQGENSLPLPATMAQRNFKYLAIAASILLLLSIGLNIFTYNENKKLATENNQLALQRDQLYASGNKVQTNLKELEQVMKNITSPDIVQVRLSGVPGKPNNEVIVYWGQTTKDVYLSVKNLPAAPAGKQYQLWALLDGKPVDAGVLGDCATVCKLKNIDNAQAFAITLENAGGSATPNLEQLFVMGKI